MRRMQAHRHFAKTASRQKLPLCMIAPSENRLETRASDRVWSPPYAKYALVPTVQSYNRYSYVMNNPTNLTDPTGFVSCGEKLEGSNISRSCDQYEKAAEKCTSTCFVGVKDKDGNLQVKAVGVGDGAVKVNGDVKINAKNLPSNASGRDPELGGGRGDMGMTQLQASSCTSVVCNSNNYGTMNQLLNNTDGAVRSNWFGLAAETTGRGRVGQLDLPGSGVFTDKEADYLKFVHHALAPHNYLTFDTLLRGKLPDGVAGGGKSLDYALVDKEQRLVSTFTNRYFDGKPSLRQEVMSGLNKSFDHNSWRGPMLSVMDSAMYSAMQKAFGSTRFDFANEEHRRRLGHALIDIRYAEDKK